MWSLAWSVVALYIANGNNKLKEYQKWILVILINVIAFPADFSSIAVMSILSMYSARGNLNKQMKAMMLKEYNGERRKTKWLKWFFYLYYPLHLVLIGILRIILYGNIPILFS